MIGRFELTMVQAYTLATYYLSLHNLSFMTKQGKPQFRVITVNNIFILYCVEHKKEKAGR